MKKSLQLILAIAMSSPMFAQRLGLENFPVNKASCTKGTSNTRSADPIVSAAITIYSEDFATGLPGTWTVTDNAGNGEVWAYTTTGSVSQGQLDTVGTTAENGYMMFDSDGGGPGPAENCDLISPAINCTGQSQIFLAFNQWYWEYSTDTAYVGVSTDGVTWTYIYCPDTSLDNFQQGPNHEQIIIDISTIAANQGTIYLKFHYEGNFDWWWFVDDIMVYVPSAVDASLVTVNPVNSEYTRIPMIQANPVAITGTIRNIGGTPLTGATATFEVFDTISNAVVFSSVVPITVLPSLATANIASATLFVPPVTGYYRSRISISAALDADTTNNKATVQQITNYNDSVFARDNNVMVGSLGIGAGPGEAGMMGQNYMLANTDVLTSVSFYITDEMSPNPAGTPVFVTIHPQGSAEPSAAIGTTDTLMLTPAMIPAGGAWFTLPVSGGPLWMNAGLYYIGVHEEDSILTLATTSGIITPNTVWVTWNSIPGPPAVNGWATADAFGFMITYAVRANFGPVVNSISDNSVSGFGMYPNPATDLVTLTFATTAERNITVFNAAGQAVSTSISTGSQTTVDFSTFAAGVYMIQVGEGDSASVQKITITR